MKSITNQFRNNNKDQQVEEHQHMEMHHTEALKDLLVKVVTATGIILKSLIQNVFIQFLKSQATLINIWHQSTHMVREMEEMELFRTWKLQVHQDSNWLHKWNKSVLLKDKISAWPISKLLMSSTNLLMFNRTWNQMMRLELKQVDNNLKWVEEEYPIKSTSKALVSQVPHKTTCTHCNKQLATTVWA